MNYLEQLIAEWNEFSGYFVRTNPRARKRTKGGWDIELDVLAYDPREQILLHIESSGDADAWAERKSRFLRKKFILSHSEYETIVGTQVKEIRKIALVGWSESTKTDLNWGSNIEVILIPNFIQEIIDSLKKKDFMKEAVPEGFPLLRTIQLIIAFNKK